MNKTKVLNLFFWIIITVTVIVTGISLCFRDGRDLKVGLYGVEQVKHKKSPYDNFYEPTRPLFRYAPGVTILQRPFMLKSVCVDPFTFVHITPSVYAWYLFELLTIALSALILLKLIPAPSKEVGVKNLKIAILMALPFLVYELANSQNKLVALFFMLAALLLFKKKKMFFSAVLFCMALTVYIPLFVFGLYFLLKGRVRFAVSFIAGAIAVFIVVPSLFFGWHFNNFLLREWFTRTLKPFFFTTSYASYLDLRFSNQSLPGAIGRLLVPGGTESFHYLISPALIHIIIRIFSAFIVLFSCIAVWKNSEEARDGLVYSVFLILALILPQYCIYYTWAWTFVLYFAVLNYVGRAETSVREKKFLFVSALFLFLSTCLVGVSFLKYFSVIFWATFILWAAMTGVIIRKGRRVKVGASL